MVTYPSDWKEKTLAALTQDIITGGTPSTSHPDFWDGDIPWLSSTAIHQRQIFLPTRYITSLGLDYSSAKIAPKDSVLVALAGQGKTRGTVAVLMSPMAINQSLAALVANKHTDSRFLFYLMSANYLELRELSSGDGGRGGLNKKLLRELCFTIPADKKEQSAIASVLTSFDTHIENLSALIQKKRAIRDGALEDLMSGRTRLAGFSGEWTKIPFSEFTEINPYTEIPEVFTYVDLEAVKGITLISPRKETKNTAPSRAKRYAHKGDVFYQTVRPYQKNNFLFYLEGNYVFSTGYAQLRTQNSPHFLFLLIRNDTFVNKVLDNCTGTSYPAINPKRLGEIMVYVPVDVKEQEAIASVLSAMDEEITALEAERDKYAQLREGVMDDLLTGRVRLNV